MNARIEWTLTLEEVAEHFERWRRNTSTLTITDPDMLKMADPPDAQLFMGRWIERRECRYFFPVTSRVDREISSLFC